ncbi:hypothetical protein [Candidatus Chlorohelix sp.]|uniref:hypothetical protein n=1 Tax=Candidatus Chlorohelix sp. TaxID=3139201 RepID=UPI0030341BA5
MSNKDESKVSSSVIEESGQWAVYLEVTYFKPGGVEIALIHRKYIRSFSTRKSAEVAAYWYKRTAERDPGFADEGV